MQLYNIVVHLSNCRSKRLRPRQRRVIDLSPHSSPVIRSTNLKADLPWGLHHGFLVSHLDPHQDLTSKRWTLNIFDIISSCSERQHLELQNDWLASDKQVLYCITQNTKTMFSPDGWQTIRRSWTFPPWLASYDSTWSPGKMQLEISKCIFTQKVIQQRHLQSTYSFLCGQINWNMNLWMV